MCFCPEHFLQCLHAPAVSNRDSSVCEGERGQLANDECVRMFLTLLGSLWRLEAKKHAGIAALQPHGMLLLCPELSAVNGSRMWRASNACLLILCICVYVQCRH